MGTPSVPWVLNILQKSTSKANCDWTIVPVRKRIAIAFQASEQQKYR